jgi:hypothetical protein
MPASSELNALAARKRAKPQVDRKLQQPELRFC